ncbi:MAG TPA: ATP-binding protein [Mycobacteriales bacterium]|nr:ATP-binding protein [Mycobacteriales bacterium]
MADDDLRDDSVLTYCCAVTPHALWLLRRLLEQWLAERHVAADDADDLVVIVNELCSSAVVHGNGEEIEVSARLVDHDVHVEVVGHAPQSAVEPAEIALARTLSADLDVEMSPHRAVLRCRRPVRLTQPA